MVLMIDNYDSFTYNLVQYFGVLGQEVRVYRNDKVTAEEVEALRPERIVISPGPGDPSDGGVSVEVLRRFAGRVPVLGVCLGHQALGYAYGASIVRAKRIMHGKTSAVHHDGSGVHRGIPSPFEATRYHSLVIRKDTLPPRFRVTAWTVEDDEIMGIADDEARLFGIQYHPESILTRAGMDILKNFLEIGGREQGSGNRGQESGSRNQAQGVKDQGPRTKDQGPRTKDQGPRTKDQDPAIRAPSLNPAS